MEPEKLLATGWNIFLGWQRFVRLPAFGFSALIILLGAATVAPHLGQLAILGLLAVALTFHQFGYVLNDVIDLPIDRRHPSRVGYPLVRGIVRPWQALIFALIQIPLAFGLTAWLHGIGWAYAALAGAFLLGAAYNVWGKRMRFPPLTDLTQGLCWGCFALYGAVLAGAAPNRLTWALASFVVVYIVLVNGVHASLRDLASDTVAGARTTAIVLGARPAPGVGATIPTRLVAYGLTLQLAAAGLLFWPLLANDFAYAPRAWLWVLILEIALQLVCLLTTVAVFRARSRGSAGAAIVTYIIVSLIGLIVLFGPRLGETMRLALILAYFVPLVMHDTLYKALGTVWRRRVKRQTAT
jgi:4-hydroxybenzoate polyprenyltransferase